MHLQRIESDWGRYYRTPDGIFPSVTTVLSSIPVPELQAWIESIGAEKAAEVSRKAAAKGTRMHSFCEAYLKKESPVLDLLDRHSYAGLTTHLDLITPFAIEKSLWSKRIGVAGTIDCIGKYKGTMSIIDFKSTSKLKHEGEFDSYWLQCAAYAVMVYERTGVLIRDLVIIMQDLTAGECNVYTKKADEWILEFKKVRDAFDDKSALLS